MAVVVMAVADSVVVVADWVVVVAAAVAAMVAEDWAVADSAEVVGSAAAGWAVEGVVSAGSGASAATAEGALGCSSQSREGRQALKAACQQISGSTRSRGRRELFRDSTRTFRSRG